MRPELPRKDLPGRATMEQLSHTAEVRLRLWGATLGDLLSAAGRALAELELGKLPAQGDGAWRDVEVHARDREALLVDWLNELVYRAEADRWVAVEFQVVRVTDAALVMRARGVSLDAAPSRVKAATFHGLRVVASNGGVQAEVILDV